MLTPTGIPSPSSAKAALLLERSLYRDLLLSGPEDGLADVQDAYLALPQKSTAFMRWAVLRGGASLRHLLMIDDDVYLDMSGLRQWLDNGVPVQRFYGGEVCMSVCMSVCQ
jgi:hypothetical protein